MSQQLHLVFEIISTNDHNKEIWLKIKENFETYKNIPLDEIDIDHNWIKTDSNILYERKNYGRHFLTLQTYRCIKTQSLGFTFNYKNKYIIKPFKIIKHNWKRIFKNNTSLGNIYAYFECKDCGIPGIKQIGSHKDEIFPQQRIDFTNNNLTIKQNYSLTCDEFLISNVII